MFAAQEIEMTGTSPSGTPIRVSHEFVADQFWKLSDDIHRAQQTVKHLVGMEEITGELERAKWHWRDVARKVDAKVVGRAHSRYAAETERLMQD